ncbi:MAG: hypothetical protein ACLUG7_10265 [Lachnospiraceae bacterium]
MAFVLLSIHEDAYEKWFVDVTEKLNRLDFFPEIQAIVKIEILHMQKRHRIL